MSKHLDGTNHELTQECLRASADAHYIAGCLMVDKKVDRDAFKEAVKQLERTVRYLKKFVIV